MSSAFRNRESPMLILWPMHIGENIRAIREKQGLSQKDLAQKLKIRKATIACLEQRHQLSDAAIKRTAEALGVSLDDIKNFEKDD